MTFASKTDPWLPAVDPRAQPALRIFCFPYAGGGTSIFRTWQSAFPSSVQICAVQIPGRESRIGEPLCQQLEPLVGRLAAALLPYMHTPSVFFGHSMGALIAFELARYLAKSHTHTPRHLLLSGRRAPHIPDPSMNTRHMSDDAFVAWLNQRYQGIPEQIQREPELMRLFLPILRADFTLLETYTYREEKPLDCPISVFFGESDSLAPPDSADAWGRHTTRALKQRSFPGGHFYLRTEQALLLEAVRDDIQQYLG